MFQLAYALLGRYTRLRAQTNILTAEGTRRSFTLRSGGDRPHTFVSCNGQPIPVHALRQLSIHFEEAGTYVEVRFARIGRRSALRYGESTIDGMLRGITPGSMTFHPYDDLSYAVMMGDALVLCRVAVTVEGLRCTDGWEKLVQATLPCVVIEPDGRVLLE